METIDYVVMALAAAAVAIVLIFGLVNMMRGGSPQRSQKLMELRVVTQFIAVIVVLLVVWFTMR